MFEKAIELGSTSVEYRYELGLSYSYLGDCEQAIFWFEQTLELDPDCEIAHQGLRECESTP
jgi:tetratricopeptide (TPR) repeat protein